MDDAISALVVAHSAAKLGNSSVANDGFRVWAVGLLDLIAGLEPAAATNWCVVRRALSALVSTAGVREGHRDAAELLALFELADLADVCGQTNRAPPFDRDLVGRFFKKSVTQGSFFRDVRLTPAHFDELVALTSPHLPPSSRGPSTMPSVYRIFTVLFWLSQGGRQRVVSRAVDVVESTFSKHCEPVFDALLAGLPKPDWPGPAGREHISSDFAQLTGGNPVRWKGLYVCVLVPLHSAERWLAYGARVQADGPVGVGANQDNHHALGKRGDGIFVSWPHALVWYSRT